MKIQELLEGKNCPCCKTSIKECSCSANCKGCDCNALDEGERHGNSKVYDKCWDGYKKVPGKKRGEKGSCVKEDASAGATSAGGIASVAANGFANGGIGTLSRAGIINKKRKKKTKN